MSKTKRLSRTAGWLYLAIAIVGPFAILYVPQAVIDMSDPMVTLGNLVTKAGLYRAGMGGEMAVVLMEIVLVGVLYVIFEGVNRTAAVVMAFSRLSMAVIQGVNVLIGLVPVLAAGQPENGGIVLTFLKAHEYGVYVWQAVFAVHLVFLGYLVWRSGVFPKILGYALAAASLGYLADSIHHVVAPGVGAFGAAAGVLLVVSTLAELAFTLWLVIKGASEPKN